MWRNKIEILQGVQSFFNYQNVNYFWVTHCRNQELDNYVQLCIIIHLHSLTFKPPDHFSVPSKQLRIVVFRFSNIRYKKSQQKDNLYCVIFHQYIQYQNISRITLPVDAFPKLRISPLFGKNSVDCQSNSVDY